MVNSENIREVLRKVGSEDQAAKALSYIVERAEHATKNAAGESLGLPMIVRRATESTSGCFYPSGHDKFLKVSKDYDGADESA